MHYIEINIFVEKALTSFSKIDESEDTETSAADEEAPTASRTTSESENAETVEAAETVPSSRTLQTEETDGDIAVDDGIIVQSIAPTDNSDEQREESIMTNHEKTDSNVILSNERQHVKPKKLVDMPEIEKNEYLRIKQSAINDATVFNPESIRFTDLAAYESNHGYDIKFETEPYQYKSADIDSGESLDLLINLLRRPINLRLRSTIQKSRSGCPPRDMLVEYVYEHDIYNQIFNSSLQELTSSVAQRLQSDIIDSTVEEVYRRNLAADVTNHVRLIRMVDVSKEYNNNPAVRYYVSIVVRKSLIPVFRHILTLVFDKLQRKYFATPNKETDWNNMVLLSTQ
ncbi:unnamed protein product [Rotaria sp. Silwood1]|nr:unnamed protein product [Rotaria sp. Silwood1]